MDKKKILGNSLLLLTALIWGTSFIFQRVSTDHISPLFFGSSRMVLATFGLWIIVKVTEARKKKKGPGEAQSPEQQEALRKNTLRGGVICGVFLTLGMSFQQMGIVYTTAGKTGFITALYIVFVPVIGGMFLKHRTTWLVGLAVVLATVGMYFLSIDEKLTLGKGDALVLICAVFYALHILSCDHFVLISDPLRLSMYQFATCAVLSGIASFLFEQPTLAMLTAAAIPIIYTGFISGGAGYTLQMIGQQFTDPTVASLILSLEAVFGVLGGWLVLQEIMTPREVIGCMVVFTAIILAQVPLPDKKERIID